MRRLVAELLPTFRIRDCGGGGKCGNNSLAYLAAKASVFHGDDDQLRRRVCDHARFLLGVNRVWAIGSATVPQVTVRTLLETALRTWAPPGKQTRWTGHRRGSSCFRWMSPPASVSPLRH